MIPFGMKPRATMSGAVPYFPSPEDQASAIPTTGRPSRFPALGMFGNAGTFPFSTPGIGDGVGGNPDPQADWYRRQTGMPIGSPHRDDALPSAPPSQLEGQSGGTSRNDVLRGVADYQLPEQRIDTTGLAAMQMPKIKGPGFFNTGGLGQKLLNGLGEFALQYQASQGDQGALMTLRGRMDQQAAQRQAIEGEKRRQTERDEWMWRENYKREHPDDQFTQYLAAAGIDPRSPQGQAMYRQRAESMAAPPLMAVDGFDAQGNPTKTFMPRNGIGIAGPPAAAAGPAIGTVKNGYRFTGGNPNDRYSWVPAGGAPSAGGATFP